MILTSRIVALLELNYPFVFAAIVGFSFFVYFTDKAKKSKVVKEDSICENDEESYSKSLNPELNETDDDLQPTPALDPDTRHIPYRPAVRDNDEMVKRSKEFYELMNLRRTVRMFSSEPVPQEVLENIIRTAGTSPSGAHTEPWTFVLIQDNHMKEKIREIVEEEEYKNYTSRMSRQWVADLKAFKTDYCKPYLTEAPALILVFKQTHSFKKNGEKRLHYYNELSVAIAVGILLASIQYAGMTSLVSTPLNSGPKINQLLGRPTNERLMILLPVGKPHPAATVPDIKRKSYDEISVKF